MADDELDAAASRYIVHRTTQPGTALLDLDDGAWSGTPQVAWGPEPYRTAFGARWDDVGLYVRFDVHDPSPWSTMTRHDEHLWEEEVVEIFIDPNLTGRGYAELEISPANVICDVRMIAPWPNKEMDLSWHFASLRSRVHEWRDAAGRTLGWRAVACLPWTDFESLPTSVPLPPRVGDGWRFNVFRIKRPGGPTRPEEGAILVAWSPTGSPSFHEPAAFRPLVFAD
ncbi:MAG: carbohydrate-binding family 9-like protein [Vicinamibacterales bacterium]